jgi:hypothetical protein
MGSRCDRILSGMGLRMCSDKGLAAGFKNSQRTPSADRSTTRQVVGEHLSSPRINTTWWRIRTQNHSPIPPYKKAVNICNLGRIVQEFKNGCIKPLRICGEVRSREYTRIGESKPDLR